MSNTNLFRNKNIWCNLDLALIKDDLLKLFKSPNPIHIYLNSQNIKDNFSEILSCLALKIKQGFKIDATDEKTFAMTVYRQTDYHKIWIEVCENYLRDIKNFDLLNYLYFVKTFNKEKQYLGKALMKMYKKNSENDIRKFLVKFNSKISFKEVKEIFQRFQIAGMSFDINLREDFIEHFIEKIYLQLDETEKSIFLDHFVLKIDKTHLDFNDVSKVMLKIFSSYISDESFSEIDKTLCGEYFSGAKLCVDDLIARYVSIRSTFYVQVNDILSLLNQVDRAIFWKYIKRKMIDLYYPEVKNIFYNESSQKFFDKDTYSLLAGEFKLVEAISPEAQYIQEEYKQINDLKELILELNNNLFSFFLLPIVYYTISEKLALRKKDLHKMKYMLLFIFSSNYSEYKKIYMFFNQLEVFLNYENKPRTLEKIQVWFSIILSIFLLLLLSYFYLPIWVFLWVFILSAMKYFEVVSPNIFYRQKWNIGIKFFATLFLCISTYFWFSNFDKVKQDTVKLTNQIEVLGTISSKEVIDWAYQYIKVTLFEAQK